VSLDPTYEAWYYHGVCPESFDFKDSLTGWMVCWAVPTIPDHGGGIYKTTDGGASWSSVLFDRNLKPNGVFYSSLAHSTLVSVSYGLGLLGSTDDGLTWKWITNTPYYITAPCTSMNLDSVVEFTTTSVSFAKWLRSTNAGAAWSEYGIASIHDAFIEAWQPYADPSTKMFYAVLDGGGWNAPKFPFYRSSDYGLTWQTSYAFRPTTSTGDGITGCVRGDGEGRLFVQDMSQGILTSTDSGSSWTQLCGPSNWYDTRFGVIGPYVIAAAYDGSLWRLDTRRTAGVTLPDSIFMARAGCQSVISTVPLTAWSVCGNGVTLDSCTVAAANTVPVNAGVLPRPLLGEDSILLSITGSNRTDTSAVTLHLTVMGKRVDTVVRVIAKSDMNTLAQVGLVTEAGSDVLSLSAGTEKDLSLRMSNTIDRRFSLNSLRCRVSFPADLTTKSGPSLGMNGWQVTKEVMNGSQLQLEVSRQTPIDLHAGDEIVRIPIRANVALDTVGYVVLTDYSFNADFKGCTPESITPDTVKITVTPECGDSTIRHFMRSGVPFAVSSIRPNPARDELHVDLERVASDGRAAECECAHTQPCEECSA
jgi:hypothetical protein